MKELKEESLKSMMAAFRLDIAFRLLLFLFFTWFGWSQILHSSAWISWVPGWTSFVSPRLLVFANGLFESLNALILFSRFERVAAALLGLKTLFIVATIGYGDLAVRDSFIGVAALLFALRKEGLQKSLYLKKGP